MIITPWIIVVCNGLLAGIHIAEEKPGRFLCCVVLVVIALGDIFWWGR